MAAERDFDLFVIGAGSGGVRAARISARHGARVGIAEESRYGGTCVIRGCVPKKLLVYGSAFRDAFEDARGFGWDAHLPAFDWPSLIAAKDREIGRLEGIYRKLLSDAGVTPIEGRARLVDAHTVEVAGRCYTTDKVLVATGGWPVVPPIPGREHAITSNEALDLPTLPRRVVIVGGGFIAVEFAGIFNSLGSETTMLVRGEQLLRGFDDDARIEMAREMSARGITIHARTLPAAITGDEMGLTVRTAIGQELAADAVLFATGREPNSKGIGLEEAGVKLGEGGAVAVDEWSRTSVENIFAVGDVTDRVNLTPVAIAEGHAFADTQFGGRPRRISHDNIASAVFGQPPLAAVGLTEAEARARHGEVDIYRSRFRPMKHTLSGREERTMMKLVVDAASDRILGAHMVGADAPEIIQGLAIAITAGATKAHFDRTIGIHPTAAEEFVTMREKVAPAVKVAAE
ncbi:NADPH-glutathione reductase [Stella humosa]|uniref:Glutathione reductase n=1 Tax=Stella humosa TaxID=94 RepID=A0A3N1M9E7_9PROT|nr:glutathione-disulfide reductase [Stella humosa]ROP99664.1 NADPH-glutathione reductase [Stella humosa]BBK31111.1 glutathione-disulfide reductase [Stella humosa]